MYTIEFSTPNTAHRKYVIQTDDIELEFSKVFIEYQKCALNLKKLYKTN